MALSPLCCSAAVPARPSTRQERVCISYIKRLIQSVLLEQNAVALLALDSLMIVVFSEVAAWTIDPGAYTEVSSSMIGFFISNLLHGPINRHILKDHWIRARHKLDGIGSGCAHGTLAFLWRVFCCGKKRDIGLDAHAVALTLEDQRRVNKRRIVTCLIQTEQLLRRHIKTQGDRQDLNKVLSEVVVETESFRLLEPQKAHWSDLFFVSPFLDQHRISALSTALGILICNTLFDPSLFAAGGSAIFGAVFTCVVNFLFHVLSALVHCDRHFAFNKVSIKLAGYDEDFCSSAAALPSKIEAALTDVSPRPGPGPVANAHTFLPSGTALSVSIPVATLAEQKMFAINPL